MDDDEGLYMDKKVDYNAQIEEWKSKFSGSDWEVGLRFQASQGSLRNSSLRSVAWMVFLNVLSEDVNQWNDELKKSRTEYTELNSKVFLKPEDDIESDPLSLDEESPWNQHFENVEIIREIKRDVERTFPDIKFFQQERIQQMLTDVLFVYVKGNPDPGYRQGMHEILAPLLHIRSIQSVNVNSLSNDHPINSILDDKYIEHDTYWLFENVMKTAGAWFEISSNPRPPVVAPDRKATLFQTPFSPVDANSHDINRKQSKRHSQNKSEDQDQTAVPDTAILRKLNHINATILRRADPKLYKCLQNYEIEPQIYGLRWIRLLFGREFEIEDVWVLWDAIFSDSITLELVDYIAVAMLILIREELLAEAQIECLMLLMKYPPGIDVQRLLVIAKEIRTANEALSNNYESAMSSSASSSDESLIGLRANETTFRQQSLDDKSIDSDRLSRTSHLTAAELFTCSEEETDLIASRSRSTPSTISDNRKKNNDLKPPSSLTDIIAPAEETLTIISAKVEETLASWLGGTETEKDPSKSATEKHDPEENDVDSKKFPTSAVQNIYNRIQQQALIIKDEMRKQGLRDDDVIFNAVDSILRESEKLKIEASSSKRKIVELENKPKIPPVNDSFSIKDSSRNLERTSEQAFSSSSSLSSSSSSPSSSSSISSSSCKTTVTESNVSTTIPIPSTNTVEDDNVPYDNRGNNSNDSDSNISSNKNENDNNNSNNNNNNTNSNDVDENDNDDDFSDKDNTKTRTISSEDSLGKERQNSNPTSIKNIKQGDNNYFVPKTSPTTKRILPKNKSKSNTSVFDDDDNDEDDEDIFGTGGSNRKKTGKKDQFSNPLMSLLL